jgi:glycosyltransferase involved in cell wall biosynthesis
MLNSITAIISVFNGEKYIAEAIQSILDQTVSIAEIIIINDGSTDNTQLIIENIPSNKIILIYQSNKGQAQAVNVGIMASKGEFLTFLDADDLWVNNKTELQLAMFRTNPTLDLCFANIQEFISPELSSIERQKLVCNSLIKAAKLRQVLMIKKEFFLNFGFFPEVETMDFIAWYALIKKNIRSEMHVDHILVKRRLHQNNISRRNNKNTEIARTFKLILEQRRNANKSDG